MNKIGLVRTMNHTHNDHGRGSYWMFTGYQYLGSVPDVNSMSRADMPHVGSMVAKLAPGNGPMFPFAIVPHRMDVAGGRRAGQFAGSLGGRYDPMLTGGNPNDDNFRLDHLPLAANADAGGIAAALELWPISSAPRRSQLQDLAITQNIRDNQARALDVLSSDAVRRAVDLAGIPAAERPHAMAATCSGNRFCWAAGCSMPALGSYSATGSVRRARTVLPGTRTGTISPPTRKIWSRRTIRRSTP